MMALPHVILTISSKLVDKTNFVDNCRGTMRKLVLFGMVGVLAQLIDGALGMAYGLTSTTLLVAVGTAPAAASATVHLAELGTTAVSGISHWRFGNVDWRTVRMMTFPGFVGAFLGAVVLSSIRGDTARPWVAVILSVLGVYVLFRFLGKARGPRPRAGNPLPWPCWPRWGSAPASWTRSAAVAGGRSGPRPCSPPAAWSPARSSARSTPASSWSPSGPALASWSRSAGARSRSAWSCCCWPAACSPPRWPPGWSSTWPPQARRDRRGGHPAHQRPHPGLDLRRQRGLADRHVPGHRGRGRRPGRLATHPVPPAPPG